MSRLTKIAILGYFPIAVAIAAEPSSEDSIAAAKRELELIKATSQEPAARSGGLPTIQAPELNTGASETAAWLQRERTRAKDEAKQQKQRKSANWLVDAMMKQPDGTGNRGGPASRGGPIPGLEPDESTIDGFFSAELEAGSGAAPAENESRRREKDPVEEHKSTETAFNPLAAFLGDWMSAQDFALLGTALQQSSQGTTGTEAAMQSPSSQALEPTAAGPMVALRTGDPSGAARTIGPTPMGENPFLQAFEDPVFAAPSPPAPSITPAPEPAPAWTPPAPAPPPAQGSRIPDFVKPQPDQKYFKQLKRF